MLKLKVTKIGNSLGVGAAEGDARTADRCDAVRNSLFFTEAPDGYRGRRVTTRRLGEQARPRPASSCASCRDARSELGQMNRAASGSGLSERSCGCMIDAAGRDTAALPGYAIDRAARFARSRGRSNLQAYGEPSRCASARGSLCRSASRGISRSSARQQARPRFVGRGRQLLPGDSMGSILHARRAFDGRRRSCHTPSRPAEVSARANLRPGSTATAVKRADSTGELQRPVRPKPWPCRRGRAQPSIADRACLARHFGPGPRM